MSIMPQDPDSKPVSPRKAISRRLRYEILRRDDHACRYCGGRAPDVVLTIDHVTPVALGGGNDPSNLVACCKDCNAGKTSTNPDAGTVGQVSEDALRWAAAMQNAADKMIDDLEVEQAYIQHVDEAWKRWTAGPEKDPVPRPTGWWNSVTAWRRVGLPIALTVDAVQIAMGNDRIPSGDTWRYFCGIVWNRVNELQVTAKAELQAIPQGEELDRAVAASARAFPWDTEPKVDSYSRRIAHHVLLPTRHLAHFQLRALSEVVDGPADWNRNAALAELGASN